MRLFSKGMKKVVISLHEWAARSVTNEAEAGKSELYEARYVIVSEGEACDNM